MATSTADDGGVGGCSAAAAVEVPVVGFQVDDIYEFSAPRFFDFENEETAEEIRRAELWFETALSYAQSPFLVRIKGRRRSVQMDNLYCDPGEVENQKTEAEEGKNQPEKAVDEEGKNFSNMLNTVIPEIIETQREEQRSNEGEAHRGQISEAKTSGEASILVSACSSTEKLDNKNGNVTSILAAALDRPRTTTCQASEACATPDAQRLPSRGAGELGSKNQTARKIASLIRKTSAPKAKDRTPRAQTALTKQKSAIKCATSIGAKKGVATDVAQENQAIKRQKLDDGRCHRIHDVKNRVLLHKSKPGMTGNGEIFASGHQEKEGAPFISAAEMVKKFQSKTREIDISLSRPHDDNRSSILRRPKLTLTRPKEPELATGHRVRAVRIKSTAELEEEMLAKIPKFKARPVNKKIFEAPTLPLPPRSTPRPPEFQEFNLKTTERASRNAGTSSALSSSIDSSSQEQPMLHKLTEPRPPHLETLLRARPPKVKSSEELEQEELEKMPKFKARPLNKKILESRGDLALLCNEKSQITIPREFHFATDERMGPSSTTASVVDLFDKLSLHSEAHSERQFPIPRMTVPSPFHLQTEERGLDKERQLSMQRLQRELEEERVRIPKANPYPYTTDYPVVPPKPAPKECTKPEAFQLESLVRHEEAMQRKMEEKEKMEKEEAERRLFRAQPVLNTDPFPAPKKDRKPLTEVQGFELHVDHRATDRSEFDKKIKEKETVYKRLRDEYETSKMIEEEKAVKQLRRTMVPHARPLPSFDNPFLPQKSNKEATKAKSPALKVAQRLAARRRQCGGVSQMR